MSRLAVVTGACSGIGLAIAPGAAATPLTAALHGAVLVADQGLSASLPA